MLAILAAAASLGGGADPAPGEPFQPIAAGDAIAYFRRMCVDTMPEPRAFATALNVEPPGWVRYQKSHRGSPVVGHFWRSSRGELSYVNLPGLRSPETNPVCHYAFRRDPEFSHNEVASALARALGLDSGRPTGSRRGPQTRWEGTLPNGLRVRVFLSSDVEDMRGPASRLSISAYRDSRRSE